MQLEGGSALRKNSFDWFRLDNAAKIFPGQNSNTWSNIYRLSIRLKEEVDKDTLQTALESTLVRIPSFNVRIRQGFFWHYFEHNDNIPIILEISRLLKSGRAVFCFGIFCSS